MTKSEAIKKIENSISEGAQLIVPKGVEYETHLEQVVSMLMDSIIEPEVATINSACFPEYDYEKYKSSKVWAIAHKGDNWLLTIEGEEEFALGFGKSSASIMMHGFSSSDAVGEWCA